MKNFKSLSLFLLVTASPLPQITYAMQQHVETCLTINSNTSPYALGAGFFSTDKFDWGTFSPYVKNGKTCASHTYQHGPKWISAVIGASYYIHHVKIVPNRKTCADFYNTAPGKVTNHYMKSSSPNITWDFTLDQVEPEGEYKYVFNLNCHSANS